MEGGARPAARRLMKRVRHDRSRLAWSGEGHPTASLRWLGRKPDGPGADPFGKDLAPLSTADSLREIGAGTGPGDSVGGAACGCLSSISIRMSGVGVARPLDERALMALLYWPSWTACLALRMLLLFWEEDLDDSERLSRLCPPATASDHRVASSPACHLSMRDFTSFSISRHRRRWPEGGLASRHFDIMKTREVESSSGLSHTEERQSPRALAQRSLAPLGTCLRVGTEACRMAGMGGSSELTVEGAGGAEVTLVALVVWLVDTSGCGLTELVATGLLLGAEWPRGGGGWRRRLRQFPASHGRQLEQGALRSGPHR